MAGIRPPERKDTELVKRKGKKRYYRLDVRERRSIERGLDRRESCRSMARDLGRSASTVHDEVARNRVVTRGPGKGDNVEGTDGRHAKGRRTCPKLLSWPFCCNGCSYRHTRCSYGWRCEHLADDAQAFTDGGPGRAPPRRGHGPGELRAHGLAERVRGGASGHEGNGDKTRTIANSVRTTRCIACFAERCVVLDFILRYPPPYRKLTLSMTTRIPGKAATPHCLML